VLLIIILPVISFFSQCLCLIEESESFHEQKTVYVIPVTGTIDLGLSAFIKRAVREAKEDKADAVVFKIDTFGGRIDAADEIVAAVADLSPLPTYAYVTHSAWSAGALIALACKEIIMNAGSSIGSAEPRFMGVSSSQEATDEKIISALRGKFKATAEANNHSPNLAQAMVDKEIELVQVEFKEKSLILTREQLEEKKQKEHKKYFKNERVISPKNKLLNLTAEEALQLRLSVLSVPNQEKFFEYINSRLSAATQAQIISPTLTWSENLVRFLTHPIVSSLLLSLGFLGLLFELKMPGWGISGTLGALFIILFFWGHYLVGLADWADIAVFVIGVIFVIVEIMFIPGFGVLGITGIVFILGQAFIITFVLALLGFKFISRTNLFKRVLLNAAEDKGLGFQTKSLPEEISVGTIGLSKTMLRPSGRAVFKDRAIDVPRSANSSPRGSKSLSSKSKGIRYLLNNQEPES